MVKVEFNDGWCFALVNKRLAEISFDKKYGIIGHCYVKKQDYKTKQEQRWIKTDTAKYQFSYRKGYYRDKIINKKFKSGASSWLRAVKYKDSKQCA